jgi:hypothetical protein
MKTPTNEIEALALALALLPGAPDVTRRAHIKSAIVMLTARLSDEQFRTALELSQELAREMAR